jgi:5-methylcytosine-specific restriction endonuclease McrA
MMIAKTRANLEEVHRRWMDAACKHERISLVRRTLRDGRLAIVYQCQDCGNQKAGPVKRLPEHDNLPEHDETIFPRYNKRRQDLWKRLVWEADVAAYEQWVRDYEAYLDSPAWKKKRRLVIEREGGLCQGCRQAEATEAHHSTYQHAGEEFLFQLVALCRPCHKRFHADYVSSQRPAMEACSPDPEH